jgi:hypothetical protein
VIFTPVAFAVEIVSVIPNVPSPWTHQQELVTDAPQAAADESEAPIHNAALNNNIRPATRTSTYFICLPRKELLYGTRYPADVKMNPDSADLRVALLSSPSPRRGPSRPPPVAMDDKGSPVSIATRSLA